jgi:thioredoxin-like negative regulator of GroEL
MVARTGTSGRASTAERRGDNMSGDSERAFHLARAEHCRRMAAEASDLAIRHLHEQLAQFHEAEAKRHLIEIPASEDEL